ncbi:TetR/AcrR family transcriptional regulator [Streptomyces minutiscleroticus]|uniref:TetR/AcrR family transcriptional regulator n=1 Tax=Streptomyces minutiscleroticus TaxID=68238 RepID=UPI00332D28C7
MRLDAEENEARILFAARHVFAEGGEQAPITRVARRAGVSVATVYRRFPTRDLLIADVHTRQCEECLAVHAELLRSPDPKRALCELVHRWCACQVSDKGYTKTYVDAVIAGRGLDRERLATDRVVATLLSRAQAAGTLRPDLTVGDVRLVIAGNQGIITAAGRDAAAASRRYVTHMLRSFQV